MPVTYFTTAVTAWKMVCTPKVVLSGEKLSMSSDTEGGLVGWISEFDRPWLQNSAIPPELLGRILEGFRLAVWRRSPGETPSAWLTLTVLSGGVGFLDPPGAVGALQLGPTKSLLQFVVSALQSQVNLLQLMLPQGSDLVETAALSAGFQFGADLLLVGRTCSPLDIEPLPAVLRFAPCGEELAQIVVQTYEATQDCPLLTGKRPIEDVLKGYESTGDSGKKHWRTLFLQGAPVGCVLVAHHSKLEIAELVYMGLLASARGKGLGAALLMEAEKMTLELGLSQLVIGVDAANLPARRVYESSGYGLWEQKRVLLWFPGNPSLV